ncbi:MAG: hypothetical protein LBL96_01200 [Clostridiales bacterium]|jgi:hypothetical protein|nr:hypothetical protein [Clostridiales bacterium]
MRKAYDTILSDYVDADAAGKSGGFEPYRYECACCWEEVHLCAADSRNQATHFRHRSGNNNVECENYLGYRNAIIRDAVSRRNVRDKIEFYFSNATKMFSIGVKFSADEILSYEQSGAFFQVGTASTSKPIISIPINGSRFIPDVSELIPINEFSWEYNVSSTNDSKQRKYEVFRKDGRGNLYPSFFKIQADGDDNVFQAKLVRTETLYTNTPYLFVFTHPYYTLSFQSDVKVGRTFRFSTMNRDFSGAIVTFTSKTAKVEQQLKTWKYQLEANETLTLLWPPSPQINDTLSINEKSVYIFSSFEMQPHGNINVSSKDIIRLDGGVSKILVNVRTKLYRKNVELSIAKHEGLISEYDTIFLTKESSKKFIAPDNATYLFNRSGVSPMSRGATVLLTATSEVRHFSFGYLDRIITSANNGVSWDSERILQDVLMYYKREEQFNRGDYESLALSLIAFQYIKSCENTGRINSAAKRFIEEGRI